MPEKDPLTYAAATYAWVIIWSFWAGLASFCHKIKRKIITRPSFAEFIGELVIAGFTGVLTFFLCEQAEIGKVLSAVIIGISAHMGSRAIMMVEKMLQERIEKSINGSKEE